LPKAKVTNKDAKREIELNEFMGSEMKTDSYPKATTHLLKNLRKSFDRQFTENGPSVGNRKVVGKTNGGLAYPWILDPQSQAKGSTL
jgi:hypothetical protein